MFEATKELVVLAIQQRDEIHHTHQADRNDPELCMMERNLLARKETA